MASDEATKANTRAMQELTTGLTMLRKVMQELDKNLKKIVGEEILELHGECRDYQCSTRVKHNHGITCGGQCPCIRVTRSQVETIEDAPE
jgi:hypothetical protein